MTVYTGQLYNYNTGHSCKTNIIGVAYIIYTFAKFLKMRIHAIVETRTNSIVEIGDCYGIQEAKNVILGYIAL